VRCGAAPRGRRWPRGAGRPCPSDGRGSGSRRMRRRNPRPRLRPGSGPGTLVPPRPFRCPRPAPARRPAAPEATPANTWTAPARAAYRKRLIELDAEIAEAESDADPGRIDRLRREHGLLTGEPSGVLGLGGRPRPGGDPAERARKAVPLRSRPAPP